MSGYALRANSIYCCAVGPWLMAKTDNHAGQLGPLGS